MLAAFVLFLLPLPSFASESNGTITAGYNLTKICQDTSCATYGNINWKPTINTNTPGATPVVITDTGLSGYLWGDQIGWVNLSPTGSGVTINPSTGALSGYAYANTGSWINFSPTSVTGSPVVGVSINSVGQFIGYAYVTGLEGGWIKFDCASASTCVKTDWRPIPARTTTSGGGGGASIVPIQFLPPQTSTTSPQPTAGTTTTTTTTTTTNTSKTPSENTHTTPYTRPYQNTPYEIPSWYPTVPIQTTTPTQYPIVSPSASSTARPSRAPEGTGSIFPPVSSIISHTPVLLSYPFVPKRFQWGIPFSHIAPHLQTRMHVAIPDVDVTSAVLTAIVALLFWKILTAALFAFVR